LPFLGPSGTSISNGVQPGKIAVVEQRQVIVAKSGLVFIAEVATE
jgi:hypothetical protein